MKMDLNQIIAVLKQAVGLAAVVMITVAVLRAFGVHLDFVKIGGTELAAISAAAAYISR
jgi:hypothetical protein